MRERPILFNGDMVRAILAGTKTQTRRLMRPQPTPTPIGWRFVSEDAGFGWCDEPPMDYFAPLCPYGAPGDRLWVRETWRRSISGVFFVYRADPGRDDATKSLAQRHGDPCMRWRPSIHMPRGACRLVLEIVSVRVEQAYLISDADARAEGFPDAMTFKDSWDDIYGKGAKDAAFWGWCWVIEFKRVAATEAK